MKKNATSRSIVLLFCAAALVNLYVFGAHHMRSWQDASQYDAYAVHLTQGLGYTLDGTHMSILREPGYPLFLAALYELFGVDNFTAVSIVQALLIGLCGFIVYLMFARLGHEGLALLAGIGTSLIPYYGYYSYEILTESLFTFVVTSTFYFSMKIVRDPSRARWYDWTLLGLLSGYGALVREQSLFLLPFLFVCYVLLYRIWSPHILKGMVLSCLAFFCVVGPWVLYVHQELGVFAITEGRQETSLYIRADRAALSYSQLNEYAIDWIHVGLGGGRGNAFLADNDYSVLQANYYAAATTSEAVATIKQQNIATILHHPLHYLYDNAIEVMKLFYIDYTLMNKYFRATIYALLYVGAIFGIGQLMFGAEDKNHQQIAVVSILFITYNCLIISFFDAIPRYNVPYLLFYILIAAAGVAISRRKPISPQSS